MYSIKKEVGDIAITFTAETMSEVIELAEQYAEREDDKKRLNLELRSRIDSYFANR
ncbi:coil containing protein [Vibrio phage 1.167.O._10N.261.51.F2]|nr:coil containing protein [Vibrio phage 1.167.O._10N.261.51.F2]